MPAARKPMVVSAPRPKRRWDLLNWRGSDPLPRDGGAANEHDSIQHIIYFLNSREIYLCLHIPPAGREIRAPGCLMLAVLRSTIHAAAGLPALPAGRPGRRVLPSLLALSTAMAPSLAALPAASAAHHAGRCAGSWAGRSCMFSTVQSHQWGREDGIVLLCPISISTRCRFLPPAPSSHPQAALSPPTHRQRRRLPVRVLCAALVASRRAARRRLQRQRGNVSVGDVSVVGYVVGQP